MTTTPLPIPPKFRRLVGRPDEKYFDGSVPIHVFDGIPDRCFCCGIGGLAGPLIRRDHRPEKYLGIDRHRGMIQWCAANLLEEDATFYLRELGRVVSHDGVAATTWFLFDKGDCPMMQEFQNALMINPCDLTNAVIADRDWLVRTSAEADLTMTRITAPKIHGFH